MIDQIDLNFVPVSDQDRAIEFWTQKCGFSLATDQAYGEGQRWVEVAPPKGTTKLALVPPMEEGGSGPGGNSPISFITDDIERAHAEMGEKGIEREEIMRMEPPVPPMFRFSDQDGNQFLLVQRD
jgi:catechol 2,3-dioxygenase-like lactoylglutathione lyase family enzyme